MWKNPKNFNGNSSLGTHNYNSINYGVTFVLFALWQSEPMGQIQWDFVVFLQENNAASKEKGAGQGWNCWGVKSDWENGSLAILDAVMTDRVFFEV